MTDLERLTSEYNKAFDDFHKVEEARSARQLELLDCLRQQLETEFREQYRAAFSKKAEAHKARLSELDRLAKAGSGALFPIGTKFQRWDKDGAWHSRTGRWMPKGEWAVYEIITADSLHPANISSEAGIGSHVLRLLKKDGSASAKYKAFARYAHGPSLPFGWYQEGVDPNKKETEQPA